MPRKITSPCACRGSADLVAVHRGVALGRENRLVAQQLLHGADVMASAVGAGREAVPQIVRSPVTRQRAGDQLADVPGREVPTCTAREHRALAAPADEEARGNIKDFDACPIRSARVSEERVPADSGHTARRITLGVRRERYAWAQQNQGITVG